MPTEPLTAEEIAELRQCVDLALGRSWTGDEAKLAFAFRHRIPSLLDERDRLLAEVREWLCESCRTVYPGPPQPGFSCVICPKCDGLTGPRVSVEKRVAEAQLERARALLKRLERSPQEGQGSYSWFECPDCRRATMTQEPINHAPGCELAALLGPQ